MLPLTHELTDLRFADITFLYEYAVNKQPGFAMQKSKTKEYFNAIRKKAEKRLSEQSAEDKKIACAFVQTLLIGSRKETFNKTAIAILFVNLHGAGLDRRMN